MSMKKLIESMDHIEECGMNEDPMPTAMPGADAGQPVSMNVSINASGKDHVADLINMMKNAGMSAAEPVGAPSLGMRGDMEKFRSAMDDDPEIPGDDDNPDDIDLRAGLIGALAGGAAGAAIPGAGAALGGVGGMAGGALGGAVGGPAGAAVGSKIGSAIGKAAPSAIGARIGDKLTDDNIEEDADPKLASMIAKFVDDVEIEMMYYGQPDVAKVGMLIKQGNVEDAAGEMADAMTDQDGGSDKFDMVMQTAQEYIEDYMSENEGYEFGSTPRKSKPRKSVSYDPKQSMPSIMKYAYQPDVTRALAKAAGVDSEEVYFDDADLVHGDETVVPRCGVDDNCTFGDAVKALKKFVKEGDYANEPDAQYGDMSDAIPDGNDLNRKKKSYAATQDGDNPMAVENIKAALYAALTEKKAKPDFLDMDGDGDKKEPMKKAIKDKKKKTNEAEFKKTGRDGDGSSKFDEMGCKKEMMKLNASGCAKNEMYNKVSEKYGCSKSKFEKLYASNCG